MADVVRLKHIDGLGAFVAGLRGTWTAQPNARGLFEDQGRAVYVHWVFDPGLVRFFAPIAIDVAAADVDALCRRICRVNAGLNLGGLVLDESSGVLGFYSAAVLGQDHAVGSDVVATHLQTALAAHRHREELLGPNKASVQEPGDAPWWALDA